MISIIKIISILSFVFFCKISFGQEVCDNGIDDDGDGLIDLNDSLDCNCNVLPQPPPIQLIPNPSFENYTCCPTTYSEFPTATLPSFVYNSFDCVDAWQQASDDSSDFLHICDFTADAPLPFSDGNGAAGFLMLTAGGANSLEYIGACLLSPMLQGNTYDLSFDLAGGYAKSLFIPIPNPPVPPLADPIDITIYGTPDCNDMPWTGKECPLGVGGFVVLGSFTYTPVNSWAQFTVPLTAPFDVEGIVIGGPCTLPTNPSAGYSFPSFPDYYPYFYIDDLELIEMDSVDTVEVDIQPIADLCNPIIEVTTINSLSGSYQWYLDGVSLVGATDSIYDVIGEGTGSGLYSVIYTSGLDCFPADITIDLINPEAGFIGNIVCQGTVTQFTDLSTISSGNIIDWQWDFTSDGSIDNLTTNPSNGYSNSGSYVVTLVVTSDLGCVDTLSTNVIVNPTPNANFNVSDVCLGDSAVFLDQSSVATGAIMTWQWDYGDVTGVSVLQNESYLYDSTNTYTVSLTVVSDSGCIHSVSNPISVFPNPVVNFTSPNPDGCTTWCPDFENNSSISSGSISDYLWSFGDGAVATAVSPVHCYNNNTLMNLNFDVSLMAVSDHGCVSSDSVSAFITVYPNPIADFIPSMYETTVYDPLISFTNNSQLNYYNDWNFANLGTSIAVNPSFLFSDQQEGEYEVCLEVATQYGCVDSTCRTILVTGLSSLFVPNTFTPNTDGINDFFKPIIFGYDTEDYAFMIFDRWGLLIFETSDMQVAWDGTYKGGPVQQDTYVWKLKAIDKYNGEQLNQIGHVNLLK